MKKVVLKQENIYQGYLILVNANYPIQTLIDEKQMVCIDPYFPDIVLESEATEMLHRIFQRIHSENQIVPVSGYRSLQEQKDIYNDSIEENGLEFTKKYVALPNCSEHQTGLAIDLGFNQEHIDFIRPSFPYFGICQKFREFAVQYGFIERYQQDKIKITNISDEEWHFRYIGYPHSEIMDEKNFCLEEYIDFLRQWKDTPYVYRDYVISYYPYQGVDIILELEETDTISGNNIDGFILTRKVCDKDAS